MSPTVSIFFQTYVLPLSFTVLGSHTTFAFVVLTPLLCPVTLLAPIIKTVPIGNFAHRVDHRDVAQWFAPGLDKEAKQRNKWLIYKASKHWVENAASASQRGHHVAEQARRRATRCTHKHVIAHHTHTQAVANKPVIVATWHILHSSWIRSSVACKSSRAAEQMATDVAVWRAQQPWLVTSNGTAVGNRGCQIWHSNNLQQHLAGGISKLRQDLMGGTESVITNNPVVCHKFCCQASAPDN